MLKEPIKLGSPDGITVDLVTDKEYDAYDKALKGVFHAIILPVMLGVIFSASVGAAYFATAAFLYGTVFRHKSQGFWGVVAFVFGIIGLFIVGGIA